MITVQFNDTQFTKEMQNITDYMVGYLDGIHAGKPKLMQNIGMSVKEILGKFIDSNARINPSELQHVYEWYQTGSAEARLFDIEYVQAGGGLSFTFTLRQSSSIKAGSKVPFYNKAKIMEEGIPVTIRPRAANKLVFEVDGQTVFSDGPIVVNKPGGNNAENSLKDTFIQFFTQYISQSLMDVTGLRRHFEVATDFNKNFAASKKGGKSLGFRVGLKWIAGGKK